ncbi:hypothetical protein KUCAC02_004294, partial [Chaenocephalus aceratus]
LHSELSHRINTQRDFVPRGNAFKPQWDISFAMFELQLNMRATCQRTDELNKQQQHRSTRAGSEQTGSSIRDGMGQNPKPCKPKHVDRERLWPESRVRRAQSFNPSFNPSQEPEEIPDMKSRDTLDLPRLCPRPELGSSPKSDPNAANTGPLSIKHTLTFLQACGEATGQDGRP